MMEHSHCRVLAVYGWCAMHNGFMYIPVTVKLLEVAVEGLLLATVQVYSPAAVTFRVWV